VLFIVFTRESSLLFYSGGSHQMYLLLCFDHKNGKKDF